MNTPIVRNIVSIPEQQAFELRHEALGDATDGASVKARRIPSLATREKFQARAPRGPFKILTIPQSWSDSLHAAQGADGADAEEGQ